jgi:hypothetical protein
MVESGWSCRYRGDKLDVNETESKTNNRMKQLAILAGPDSLIRLFAWLGIRQ